MVVIGGGIAGLAVAWALARRGVRGVHLYEREPLLATHASGRNAAIFRQLDCDEVGLALGARTHGGLASLPTPTPALRTTGALYLAPPATLCPLAERLRAHDVACELVLDDALAARTPLLATTDAVAGLFVADDGVLDIAAIATTLARVAREGHGVVETGRGVGRIETDAGRVAAVVLDDGVRLATASVVLAAGAWSEALAADCGAPLGLRSLRRHLAQLDIDGPVEAAGPVVWRLGDGEVYVRPESGGLLASPCDEEPWPACVPPTSAESMVELAVRLARAMPVVASARVRRSWACLRTFASDRGFVIGADPRVGGLFWLGGLGGRGMSCSLGLGELAAALVVGEPHPLAAAVSPARLLRPA